MSSEFLLATGRLFWQALSWCSTVFYRLTPAVGFSRLRSRSQGYWWRHFRPGQPAGRRHALGVGSNEWGHSSALLRSIRCRSVWPTGYDVTSRHARRPPNRNVEITDRRIISASTGRVRRWLQLRFDCNSTALRPLDVLPQFFVLSPNLQTRGHHYKLFKQRSNTRIRSRLFSLSEL